MPRRPFRHGHHGYAASSQFHNHLYLWVGKIIIVISDRGASTCNFIFQFLQGQWYQITTITCPLLWCSWSQQPPPAAVIQINVPTDEYTVMRISASDWTFQSTRGNKCRPFELRHLQVCFSRVDANSVIFENAFIVCPELYLYLLARRNCHQCS